MARVKLTEFRAKTLLIDDYQGVSINLDSLENDIAKLDDNIKYIIKVDQGIKKRGKQGLIRLDVTKSMAEKAVKELASRGFARFIAEPMLSHEESEERYLSIERVRDGMRVLYSPKGGVDIEAHPESITRYDGLKKVPLPGEFLEHVVAVMNHEHMSFVEINPLVVRDGTCMLLDAAVLVDSAGSWQSSWTENDVVEARTLDADEGAVAELNNNSPASFSFRVLNPEGSIWLLLSGGGASITIADEAHNHGKANLVGDYGEYSGGPTTEETYLYTKYVLQQMRKSKAKSKAIVIAGGVANFTDVKKTFTGVIQALREDIDINGTKNLRVFVRRGGPNEKEGLALMEAFLKEQNIYGSVHGSDAVLTDVVTEALGYVDA